jgi:hypothetical protein
MRRVPVFVAVVAVGASLMLATGAAYAQRGGSAPTRTALKKHKVPKNPCKLLTAAQVKSLIPDADAGTKTRQSIQGTTEADCYWASAGTSASLKVTVLSLPPQLPTSVLELSIQADKQAKKVSGIGDLAVVRSLIAGDVEVEAAIGRLHLSVDYNATGARDQQKAVIKLAKSVAKKL